MNDLPILHDQIGIKFPIFANEVMKKRDILPFD